MKPGGRSHDLSPVSFNGNAEGRNTRPRDGEEEKENGYDQEIGRPYRTSCISHSV